MKDLDRTTTIRTAAALVLAAAAAVQAACPADLDGDGAVGSADLDAVLAAWGPCGGCAEDLDGNGDVGFSDLLAVLSAWGRCPVEVDGACCLGAGACTVATQAACDAMGGPAWVAEADCGDTDEDRIPDAFELDDCSGTTACFAGTDPFDADSDGDGLPDGDEVYGTAAGVRLGQMGADPRRRDLFLETDWLDDDEGFTHSHRPTPESVASLVTAFAEAPVVSPCGLAGIALHVDHGQGGLFTGGSVIGEDSVVIWDSEFNVYKAAHFDPRRKGYFRYSIHCHWFNFEGNTSSGVAELPGDDFIVSLFSFVSSYNIAHTTMHELGHTMDLRHGGFENRNYKPNYNSVMNYRYDFAGVDTDCDARGNLVLDFSHGVNIALDEQDLDEAAGVCGSTWVDWNINGQVDPPYARNINCLALSSDDCGDDANGACWDDLCTVLFDHDDWGAIELPIPEGTDFIETVTCGEVDGP